MSALTGEGAGPPLADRHRAWSGPQHDPQPDRRWNRIRLALLAGWLVVIVATLLTGERHASWGDVRAQVEAGQVQSVHVSRELPARATGYTVVEVRWRRGLLGYTAEVVQARGPDSDVASAPDLPVLRSAPSNELTALQPGLRVTRDEGRSSHGEAFGWTVPSVVSLGALLLLLLGLAVLVGGPRPWRATRWAWFWLQLPPVGSIVFLLLSGPTPGLPAPRDPTRRLTGGWAFLLGLALSSALVPYR